MDKRGFLKTTGTLLAGGVLAPIFADSEPASEPRTNWAGNYRYVAGKLWSPKTVEETCRIVKSCPTIKALGARHSFNSIADSPVNQISVKSLKHMELDERSHTVTVGAGVSYGELAPYLDQHGYALHNLASLPHISVAGARATATHGSGVKNGNLSTAVSGLEMVTAEGEIVKLSREHDGERFRGAVVDLGALGVLTSVTLDVQPTFQVKQVVYENLPFEQLEKHGDQIFAAGYSVSLFTDWRRHRATQVWIKARVGAGAPDTFPKQFFGATLATEKLHPLAGHSAENCTEQLGIPGPWYERLPHFRMNFTPSSGAELQTEYFVPRERAVQAIFEVEKLSDQVSPHLFISELRTIAADELWMSPCYRRASVAIHFTWKPEWPDVKRLLPVIEEALAPFEARPHWAKLFSTAPPRLQAQYEKLPEFKKLVAEFDPKGKFRNDFLARNLG